MPALKIKSLADIEAVLSLSQALRDNGINAMEDLYDKATRDQEKWEEMRKKMEWTIEWESN